MEKTKKKEAVRRLSIIMGHLKRVAAMVDEDAYCIDILNQSLAVQKALRKVDVIVLNNHLRTCVRDALHGSDSNKEKAVSELLRLYNRSST